MQRTVPIFLILIFLFNIVGYYIIYAGLVHQARARADYQIDSNTYDRTQTITIKIPLALPYPIQNGFEPVSGNFEYQGEFYESVEQKYESDTLYVVCLKNQDEKKAQEVLEDFVAQSTDNSPVNSQNAKVPTSPIKDFSATVNNILLTPPGAILIKNFPSAKQLKVSAPFLSVSTPPPNSIG